MVWKLVETTPPFSTGITPSLIHESKHTDWGEKGQENCHSMSWSLSDQTPIERLDHLLIGQLVLSVLAHPSQNTAIATTRSAYDWVAAKPIHFRGALPIFKIGESGSSSNTKRLTGLPGRRLSIVLIGPQKCWPPLEKVPWIEAAPVIKTLWLPPG